MCTPYIHHVPHHTTPTITQADPPATSSPAPRTTLGPVTFGVAAARGARPYMEDRHCCVSFFQPVDSSGEAVDDGVAR